MRPKTIILYSILCTAAAVVMGSCSTMKSPDNLTYEKFCGTWANKSYEPTPGDYTKGYAKLIINPDGTMLQYDYLTEAGPTAVATYVVEKRWNDPSGDSYYHLKTYFFENDSTWYVLCKIGHYNSVVESNWSNNSYPGEIDPKDWHSDYYIYYRY